MPMQMFATRLDDALYARLREAAAEQGRTLADVARDALTAAVSDDDDRET